jgi:molecular chaperone DnaK
MAADNKLLGQFNLEGIPPMMAGMPQIEITYDIDANGILHVTAKEKSTGKEASITIQNTTTLSEDEVNRMVDDAEANAERDREAREHVEAKNMLDGLRSQAQRTLDESTADDALKEPVRQAITEAQNALDSDAPKSRLEELGRDLAEKTAALQQAAPTQGDDGQGGQPQSQGNQDDDVVDADFKPAG